MKASLTGTLTFSQDCAACRSTSPRSLDAIGSTKSALRKTLNYRTEGAGRDYVVVNLLLTLGHVTKHCFVNASVGDINTLPDEVSAKCYFHFIPFLGPSAQTEFHGNV